MLLLPNDFVRVLVVVGKVIRMISTFSVFIHNSMQQEDEIRVLNGFLSTNYKTTLNIILLSLATFFHDKPYVKLPHHQFVYLSCVFHCSKACVLFSPQRFSLTGLHRSFFI